MLLVLDTNRKGAIAEAEIEAAAVRLGVPVLKPLAEHGRYDLGFEIGPQLLRVQCKWARFHPKEGVIKVQLQSSSCTPSGYICTSYSENEIDLLAVYCDDLDRCYLLPSAMVAGRRAVYLRVNPPKNAQRACVNLAREFEFAGAVAQLGERHTGSVEARGSSPLSSTSSSGEAALEVIGSNEFRDHFGYHLQRAAAGDDILVTRRGRPYVRVSAAGPRIPVASP